MVGSVKQPMVTLRGVLTDIGSGTDGRTGAWIKIDGGEQVFIPMNRGQLGAIATRLFQPVRIDIDHVAMADHHTV